MVCVKYVGSVVGGVKNLEKFLVGGKVKRSYF